MSTSTDNRPAKRWTMSGLLVILGVNFVVLLIGLVFLEVIFGRWFLPYLPPHSVVVDRTFKYRQRLYEPPGEIVYTRDRYALRGVKEPLRDIQMVTLGGSTTDQKYITEGETWQDVLRGMAQVRVANAGVDGMSSSGHLVSLNDWLHKLPDFRPQIYLHYIGINDAAATEGRIGDRPGSTSWSRSIRQRSAVVRTTVNLLVLLRRPPVVSHMRIAPSQWAQYELHVAKTDVARARNYIEQVYKPNVRAILDLHESRGEKAILVSQPSHPSLMERIDGAVHIRIPDLAPMAIVLPMVNETTEAVCGEKPNICRFFDVARSVQFAPSDFYDAVHTTPAGSRRIGNFLAAELKRLEDGWLPRLAHSR